VGGGEEGRGKVGFSTWVLLLLMMLMMMIRMKLTVVD